MMGKASEDMRESSLTHTNDIVMLCTSRARRRHRALCIATAVCTLTLSVRPAIAAQPDGPHRRAAGRSADSAHGRRRRPTLRQHRARPLSLDGG